MSSAISRAQFLRGDFRGERRPARPPWSVGEEDFVSRCSRCGDCLSVCETGVLRKGRGGFPIIDFSWGECTFCMACASACAEGVIAVGSGESAPWHLAAHLGDNCLARQGVVCRTCGEQCDYGAIRFRPVVGGVALPQFDVAACHGCGACVAPCPMGAVAVHKPAEERAL